MFKLSKGQILLLVFHIIALVVLIGCYRFNAEMNDYKIPSDSDGQAVIGAGMQMFYNVIAFALWLVSSLIILFQLVKNQKAGLISIPILIAEFILMFMITLQ